MADGRTVHFVTWPDGKVDENSINAFSKGHAKCWMVRSYFPEEIFGKSNWLVPDSVVLDRIWQGMSEKGFKVHSIAVPSVENPNAK